jgi:hypothetical protein
LRDRNVFNAGFDEISFEEKPSREYLLAERANRPSGPQTRYRILPLLERRGSETTRWGRPSGIREEGKDSLSE